MSAIVPGLFLGFVVLWFARSLIARVARRLLSRPAPGSGLERSARRRSGESLEGSAVTGLELHRRRDPDGGYDRGTL